MEQAPLYCGTSGFSYPSWKPVFYPPKLPSAKFLDHYATRLNTVEVNYTFRRIAAASTFEKWIAATSEGFLFLPKAHMKITHILKLKDAEDFTRVFLESLEPLRNTGRLGPILFQLPPSFKADANALQSFLHVFPRAYRAAFEFRHPSWFKESTYETLRSANAGLCLAENEDLETPDVVTGDFVYLRLRKPNYSTQELATLEERVRRYRAAGRSIYAIFKHEETPEGALHAETLLKKLEVIFQP